MIGFKKILDKPYQRDNYPIMNSGYKTALAHMAASILRPLIKVLMRNEFTHAELTELVRQTYVEVAYDAFSIPEQKMTYSRAAVLTGLSRKEVVRLRGNIIKNESLAKQTPNRAMRVVHGWLSDHVFMDDNRKPKVLKLKGEPASFAELVAKYSGDITYGAVLDELNRIGITMQPDADSVQLLNKGYVPQQDEMEKIRIMSVCVSDLFGTAVHNIDANENDIRFQRQLVYSGIEESLAEKFHDIGSEKAMALFDTLNEFLSTERDKTPTEKRRSGKRVGLGIYYFEGEKRVQSVKMTREEHA